MSESEFAFRLNQRLTAVGLDCSHSEIEQLERFYRLLAKWNQRINLTSLPLDPVPAAAAIDRLFVEPLVGAELIPGQPLVLVDLGSGAGSPAIPLKIRRPNIHLAMIESRGRKAAFLREAVRALELTNTAVMATRFELATEALSETADMVTIRAVKVDRVALDVVSTILKPDGRLELFGGSGVLDRFQPIAERPLPNGSSVVLYRRA